MSFQEAIDGPEKRFRCSICAGLFALGSAALADEYSANEFLGLAFPRPCCRRSGFGPRLISRRFPFEAKADRGSDAQARAGTKQIARSWSAPPR